jgi:ATP-dependent DNA ligase
LATAIDKVPKGDRWIHEIKFDRYRVQLDLANETHRRRQLAKLSKIDQTLRLAKKFLWGRRFATTKGEWI